MEKLLERRVEKNECNEEEATSQSVSSAAKVEKHIVSGECALTSVQYQNQVKLNLRVWVNQVVFLKKNSRQTDVSGYLFKVLFFLNHQSK